MTNLPGSVRLALRILVPVDRNDVAGDLEEVHRRRVVAHGRRAAERMLWKEMAALTRWRIGAAMRGPAAPSENVAGGRSGRGQRPHQTARTTTMGRDLMQDIRYALRSLARRPGFTLTTVVILALGIGAPATVLTLVDTVFFSAPPHVRAPERLVRLYRSWAPGEGGGSLGNADISYYRDGARTLEGLAAWSSPSAVVYGTDEGRTDQLAVAFTSADFFDVLGVPLALGRGFRPEENATPGTHPVVVLAHGFWERATGADPEVVGRTLRFNGAPFQVVGVAPEGFTAVSPVEDPADAWMPVAMYGTVRREGDTAWWERLANSRSNWLAAVGRLAPGVTFEQARSELTALGAALEFPGKGDQEGVMVRRQVLYGPSQEASLTTLSRMLLAAVVIVLLVAMSNVAVLMLSRASGRTREMGVRTALGAGRGRLARQLLAETLLLASAGGVLGSGLAWAFADAAGSLLPFDFAFAFRPDGSVLAITAGLTVLAALAVGVAPAFAAGRADVRGALVGTRAPASRGRGREALVVVQVALSVVLVSAALLFTRSFQAASREDVGFATVDRLVVRTDVGSLDYDAARGRAFVTQAVERLSALPGVREVTTSRQIAFQGDWSTELPLPYAAEDAERPVVYLNAISPNYFEVMEIPVVRGRPFGSDDVVGAPPVIVVNEAFADLWFPDGSAVGQTVGHPGEAGWEIVGVAANAAYLDLGEDPVPQAWFPIGQRWMAAMHFVVHTEGPAAGFAPGVQEALRDIEPGLAFSWTSTLASVVEDEVARFEVSAVLVGLFGGLALILAAAGLYGVMAFLVNQRTAEIGVRMALGADRGRVARDVLGVSLALTTAGIVFGVVGSLGVRPLTTSLLYGVVDARDPLPVVAAALTLLVVAAAATWAPARRATRVDPLRAMRSE